MQEQQEGHDEEIEEEADDPERDHEQLPQPEEFETADPTTRKAFKLLKEDYKGDLHAMVRDFLQDQMCHLKMRILVECGRPLQKEYDFALQSHQVGQHSMMHWQAERTDVRDGFPIDFYSFQNFGYHWMVTTSKAY